MAARSRWFAVARTRRGDGGARKNEGTHERSAREGFGLQTILAAKIGRFGSHPSSDHIVIVVPPPPDPRRAAPSRSNKLGARPHSRSVTVFGAWIFAPQT